MQKHRFIQYIVFATIITVVSLNAQSDYWYRLYLDNDFNTIEQLLKERKISSPQWNRFFNLLFEENGEDALVDYVQLFNEANDAKLKKLLLDRISQYYYAKGLYTTAKRLYDDPNFRAYLFSSKQDKQYYGVQLGAYSTYQNALASQKKLPQSLKNIHILTKNINGKTLYVIVAGKYSNQAQAKKLFQQLKDQFNIQGMIISFRGD